jgi:XTP/dITP diphosphohydrolase
MYLRSQTIVIATRNPGKISEFKVLFEPFQIKVRSLLDYQDLPVIEEDETTFADNSRKKAQVISAHLHIPVLADDSGLCVDALQGEPGVRSARYAGEGASDEHNYQKVLQELAIHHVASDSERTIEIHSQSIQLLSSARFECALTLVDDVSHIILSAQGSCEGFIIDTPIGTHGFGYDPIFYIPHLGKTMAQLNVEEKNRFSHRAIALQKFMSQLTIA